MRILLHGAGAGRATALALAVPRLEPPARRPLARPNGRPRPPRGPWVCLHLLRPRRGGPHHGRMGRLSSFFAQRHRWWRFGGPRGSAQLEPDAAIHGHLEHSDLFDDRFFAESGAKTSM